MSRHPATIVARSVAAGRPRPVAFVAVALAAAVALVTGCRDETSAANLTPVPSPDGLFTLVPSINDATADAEFRGCVKLTVLDRDGRTVTTLETGVPARNRWRTDWRGHHGIFFVSDDRGQQCWQRDDDGQWPRVRGGFLKQDGREHRHGRWIWYNDDGTIGRTVWYYLEQETTEEEYIERLLKDQASSAARPNSP
jgi:hypothetical protein